MLTHFHITQTGQSHLNSELQCDDYSTSKRIELDGKAYIIAAVADGVGSCENARFGSRMAVETAVAFVKDHLNLFLDKEEEICSKCLAPAFAGALTAIEDYAAENGLAFSSFDTTLTVCVYDGEKLFFGHSGDDGVIAVFANGTYEMITKRVKGEEVNSVYPLREKTTWEFGKTTTSVASFALMTDGILDHVVAIPPQLHNRVFFPFLQPILAIPIRDDAEAEEVKLLWQAFLEGKHPYRGADFRKFVTDDISLVVVQNSEAVEQLPEIPFDLEAWNNETLAFRAAQKQILKKLSDEHSTGVSAPEPKHNSPEE